MSALALSYWELRWGGLIGAVSHDNLLHHVRRYGRQGTPGRTLCGVDRFAPDGPGGGWQREPYPGQVLCPDCGDVAWDVLAAPHVYEEHARP